MIFAILNITADSFSDGGRFLDPAAAIAQAQCLARNADLIDVGAASSHPDAESVPAELEISRLNAVLPALRDAGLAFSVDSDNPTTQRHALQCGAAYLNDIRGFADATSYPWLADSPARLIVMHRVQGNQSTDYRLCDAATIWTRIEDFFDARLEALERGGIQRDRLILDPGMGLFLGADIACSLAVLADSGRLRQRYGIPIMLSLSRKSFVRQLTDTTIATCGAATLAAELYAHAHGVDHIRTHDPTALRQAMMIWQAITNTLPAPTDHRGTPQARHPR